MVPIILWHHDRHKHSAAASRSCPLSRQVSYSSNVIGIESYVLEIVSDLIELTVSDWLTVFDLILITMSDLIRLDVWYLIQSTFYNFIWLIVSNLIQLTVFNWVWLSFFYSTWLTFNEFLSNFSHNIRVTFQSSPDSPTFYRVSLKSSKIKVMGYSTILIN